MRFYAQVQNLVDEYLLEMLEEPWNVFATDLLYFLACEYETGWIPYKLDRELEEFLWPTPRNYTPHPLSPFTNYMRRSIKYGIINPVEPFIENYNQIVPPGADDKLARFANHVIRAFNDFFAEDRTIQDMYFLLLYVGKLATISHLHGTSDAPQIALTLIANALLKLGTKLPLFKAFECMDYFARLVCNLFEEKRKA